MRARRVLLCALVALVLAACADALNSDAGFLACQHMVDRGFAETQCDADFAHYVRAELSTNLSTDAVMAKCNEARTYLLQACKVMVCDMPDRESLCGMLPKARDQDVCMGFRCHSPTSTYVGTAGSEHHQKLVTEALCTKLLHTRYPGAGLCYAATDEATCTIA